MADWLRLCERVGLHGRCYSIGFHHACEVHQSQVRRKVDEELDKLDAMGCIAQKIYWHHTGDIIEFYSPSPVVLRAITCVDSVGVSTTIRYGSVPQNIEIFLRDLGVLFNLTARYKKEYIRAIFALLPQPIAEEICAEFTLV